MRKLTISTILMLVLFSVALAHQVSASTPAALADINGVTAVVVLALLFLVGAAIYVASTYLTGTLGGGNKLSGCLDKCEGDVVCEDSCY